MTQRALVVVLLIGVLAAMAEAQTVAVSPASIAGDGTVTVTVTVGPGGVLDWVGLYAAGMPSDFPSLLDWKYLSNSQTPPAQGLRAATLTFAIARPPGSYVFRFFANDGFSLLASSPTLTVTPPSPPGKASLQVMRRDVASWMLSWNWGASGAPAQTIPEIERGTQPSGPFVLEATPAAGSALYEDRNVVRGQAYCWRVRGRIGAQVTAYSNVVCTP